MQALVPLDAMRLFKNKQLKNILLQEAGWYQEYNTGKDVRIVFLPAKHWGRNKHIKRYFLQEIVHMEKYSRIFGVYFPT